MVVCSLRFAVFRAMCSRGGRDERSSWLSAVLVFYDSWMWGFNIDLTREAGDAAVFFHLLTVRSNLGGWDHTAGVLREGKLEGGVRGRRCGVSNLCCGDSGIRVCGL